MENSWRTKLSNEEQTKTSTTTEIVTFCLNSFCIDNNIHNNDKKSVVWNNFQTNMTHQIAILATIR